MKKVVFFADHPAGAKSTAAVAKRMIEEERVEVLAIGHTFSNSIYNGFGIPCKIIQDFGCSDVSVFAMEKLLSVVLPNLVITGAGAQEGKSNDIVEQTSVLASRALGIPTITIFGDWQHYDRCFSDERTGQRFDRLPDYIAVVDDFGKQEMLEEGFPEGKLVVTGNPSWDNLFKKGQDFTEEERQNVRKKIGLDCKTLFFFAQNVFHQFEATDGFWSLETLKILIGEMPSLPGVGVVVRFHPRMRQEEKDLLKKVIEESNTAMKVVDDIDSLTLALAADLTIVESSNTGIEAVYMRRPVFSLQPGLKVKDNLFVSRKGVVPVGYTHDECRRILHKSVDPVYCRSLLDQSAGFANDGKATDRVVEFAYSLLQL